jgi:protein-S-isoprenylcysteine O-methyltransferase Ste14
MLSLFTKYLISAFLLLLLAYGVFRIILRQDYLHNRRASVIPLILELLVCGLYCNFPYLYLPFDWPEPPTLPDSAVRRILSLIPITVGLTITLIGIISLGLLRFLGLGSRRLRQSGIYRASRNPQIVGFFLAVAGFAIMWPSWYALGWVILFGPVFHMMVLTEEEYLLHMHAEEYRQYWQQVPRYLGFLR